MTGKSISHYNIHNKIGEGVPVRPSPIECGREMR